MEATLERAVSMGAIPVIRHVQATVGDQPRLLGMPRATGTRLEGYGVFFNIQVPTLNVPILWDMRYLVDGRATNAMIAEMRNFARMQTDVAVRNQFELFIQRLEAQNATAPIDRARQSVTVASLQPEIERPVAASEPSANAAAIDPLELYRNGVKASIIEAMLESGDSLQIGPDEWLIVSARRDTPRDPLFPSETVDTTTWVAKIKGSDLEAFRTRRITAEEVRKLVQEGEQ
jgi:hypothetical protein